MFENGKWYVVCACHTWPNPNMLREDDKSYDTYEEALDLAEYWANSGDPAACFYRQNNEWYCWLYNEDGTRELVTYKEWHERR